jgi:two-component system, OmpR family, response regulator RegX3
MKIIFLEDDKAFAREIVEALTIDGNEVDYFSSGRDCLKALNAGRYDLAIFDWEVSDMTGKEVLESMKVKGSYPPVVFLTGRDAEEDVIAIIDSGADDYIVKPTSIKILLARINALYRRANPKAAELAKVNYGDLIVDFGKRKFELNGDLIKLTEKETDLAVYFFKHIGSLLARSHLTKVIWGTSPDVDTRTIDVHVSHLRSKLKLLPPYGWRLISVYQQGYRLERLD